MINERYFFSLYSQGARAVLRYPQQVEAKVADAEERVEIKEAAAQARAAGQGQLKRGEQERVPAPLRPLG